MPFLVDGKGRLYYINPAQKYQAQVKSLTIRLSSMEQKYERIP
jgi:hypothetical protein